MRVSESTAGLPRWELASAIPHTKPTSGDEAAGEPISREVYFLEADARRGDIRGQWAALQCARNLILRGAVVTPQSVLLADVARPA
jgi:hypothetical protein